LTRQQPAQLSGPQLGTHTQLPAPGSQIWSDARQLLHCSPPRPHVAFVSPARHTPFQSQHPLHVAGPQTVVPVHVPPPLGVGVHFWLSAQLWQSAPPEPHDAGSRPLKQTPPLQQPAQLPGPHWVTDEHDHETPPSPDGEATHCWPATHVVQALPPEPQNLGSEPSQHEGGQEL